MIALIAAAVLAQAPSTELTGAQVFSKMLARYHEAKSVRGTVTLTQTATSGTTQVKVTVLSTVQVAQPNFFFLEQTRQPKAADPAESSHFLGVSDGKRISYTVPRDLLPATDPTSGKHSQFYEEAPPGIDGAMNAFCRMVLDRSLPIAVALYNPYEIQLITRHLSNLRIEKVDAELPNGKTGYQIAADYVKFIKEGQATRGVPAHPAAILIDKEFNLVWMGWSETIAEPGMAGTYKITSEWSVNLAIDGEIDKGLFTVR
jgi:hypothetical protein